MLLKSMEDRERVLAFFLQPMVIPPECRKQVKETIRAFMTQPLTEATLERLVSAPISAVDALQGLTSGTEHYHGKLAEWLVAYEYNTCKNDTNVVTIVNPDSTSQVDLLHLIRTPNGWLCKPGPDVKTGSLHYVRRHWKRIYLKRPGVSMVDLCRRMTVQQSGRTLRRLAVLKASRKKPIVSLFNARDLRVAGRDYLRYLSTGARPSDLTSDNGFRMPHADRTRTEKMSAAVSRVAVLNASVSSMSWLNARSLPDPLPTGEGPQAPDVSVGTVSQPKLISGAPGVSQAKPGIRGTFPRVDVPTREGSLGSGLLRGLVRASTWLGQSLKEAAKDPDFWVGTLNAAIEFGRTVSGSARSQGEAAPAPADLGAKLVDPEPPTPTPEAGSRSTPAQHQVEAYERVRLGRVEQVRAHVSPKVQKDSGGPTIER